MKNDDGVTAAFRELLSVQSTADAGYAAGNSIGALIHTLGTEFTPNIPALIEIYLRMYRFLAGPRKEWLRTHNDSLIWTTHPYLAFGWQIAWAISRAPASEITVQFELFSNSTNSELKAAISDLREDVSKYARVSGYPQFGGGSGPPDQITTEAEEAPPRADVQRPPRETGAKAEPGRADVPSERDDSQAGGVYPVWFGTNRKPTHDGSGFLAERNETITRGRVDVFIPKAHRFAETGTSFWRRLMRFNLRDDRLAVRRVHPLDSKDFYASIEAHMAKARKDGEAHALVFLHGYNVTFEESAIRAAQIGFDLSVNGATAFFSWPSYGNAESYPADEASIEASEGHITEFLVEFAANCGADKIHMIAHSMGNRGLLRALHRVAARVEDSTTLKFGQIFLAAPDVDRDLFIDLARIFRRYARRTTLYASPHDVAVRLSKKFHKGPRAGYCPPHTVIVGIDTIEVPDFDVDMLGHSYFANAAALLHDMFDLMRHDSPPEHRQRIDEATDGTQMFWRLRR